MAYRSWSGHCRCQSAMLTFMEGFSRSYEKPLAKMLLPSPFASKSIPSIPFLIDILTPLFYVSHVQAPYYPSLVMPMALTPPPTSPTSIAASTLQVPHHYLSLELLSRSESGSSLHRVIFGAKPRAMSRGVRLQVVCWVIHAQNADINGTASPWIVGCRWTREKCICKGAVASRTIEASVYPIPFFLIFFSTRIPLYLLNHPV